MQNDQNFKKQSQLFLLPPKWVGRGVILPILKTHESTTNPPNSVNNAQDFMSIKFKSLFRNKLHPNGSLTLSVRRTEKRDFKVFNVSYKRHKHLNITINIMGQQRFK